ncbi:MAG TPA: hypothetical protein VMG39_11450 [Pseudolabrys sp.]|nr:hypothetical protein [Pseudolabrys sp.]
MRLMWAATAAVTLISGAVSADEPSTKTLAGPSVGIGIICNTAEQAGRFVSLRAGGADSPHALQAVNAEAKDPRACGVAAVAFVRDATLDSRAVNDKLLQVVRINIVAGFNGSAWHRVSGMIQYAVIEGEGEAI